MRTKSFVVFAVEVFPARTAHYLNTRLAIAKHEVNVVHRRVVAKAAVGVNPLLRGLASSPEPR